MSDEKRKTYKPVPISGFPEWLPEIRLVEQGWMDHIRRVFESYGFCSIETPSVEALDVLRAKGEVDKEIYVLERLHRDEDDDSEARLALHFDQTVPLARYTAQHFNDLVFPFKRYQMQRVWRGERPQLGREREFYQCDIDVIGVDHLPLHFDAEMPAVIYEALEGLDIGRVQIKVSNRKILTGLCGALGIADPVPVTRMIDKMDKIGADGVREGLSALGLSSAQNDSLMALAQIKTRDPETLKARIESLSLQGDDVITEGVAELAFVLEQLRHLPDHAVTADLSIVRGLDYYTGTVYETRLLDIPAFTSSVCSGGRYDDLAGSYINKHLPGVGISIGLTRLFAVLEHHGHIKAGRKSPADMLVVLPAEERRAAAAETARALRARGYKVELYHAPQKLKKQLAYAEKKGIPYIWFPPFEDGQGHEVKYMTTGAQITADPETWTPES
ncbi:MAG: histidine--tRNA ligase [Alphaproteobacteria bacterium]|nr:histidine--tRNA ligase [Alphaproteobacteria bacterium]